MRTYRRLRPALLYIGIMAFLVAPGGCKQGEKASAMSEDIPSDLKIIIGQQGTFAGRSMGYSINADGAVLRWEGKFPEEHVEARASAPEAQVEQLWKHAREIGFLQMQEQVMSTVNTFVNVTANGESRRVTWDRRDENALTAAQQFYDACMEVAAGAFEGSEGQ